MLDGRLLNERYMIKKMIGGGGMANVYLARDTILDRDVAIKVLRLEYANDEEFIARFHREAQSATSLSHPNIVNIFDVGEEDNIYFMAMEYVEGMTLKEYIQNYGPIDVEESLNIMKQITSAITHAHANEIVHRDIKPQNILIDPFGHIKVTDFGIAVALSATSLTQTNSVLGSVHYLSPEQARGGMANKKSDIYSLGIVLFELLTGRLPFSGQTAVSIALKHLQTNTPSVRRWNPNIPQSVENIVLKSTTKDPFHRYNTVYEMEKDLESALYPDKLNEEAFLPPEDSGEETKAIPIITEDTFKKEKTTEDTIVHGKKQNLDKNKEVQVKKGKGKRRKVIIWVSLILFILVGSIASALFIIPKMLQPDDVEIPNVIGKEYEEAYSQLNDLKLDVIRETAYSDDVDEGLVIKTDPEPGETVKEGDSITVVSSQGKQKVTFENYVGQTYNQQLEKLLKQKGYQNVRAYEVEPDKDQPKGQILSQNPSEGEEVLPENTDVYFEISKGPEKITLQQLRGMSEQDATTYLTKEELGTDVTTEHSEDIPKGHVIRQEPSAFTEVEKNTVVNIVVSQGPEERPPINHSVSVTIPYIQDQNNNGNGNGNGNNGNGNGNGNQPQPQKVLIYINDMEYEFSTPFDELTITEDTKYTIPLVIQPNDYAEYQIVIQDEVEVKDKIHYDEVVGGG